MCCNYCCWTSLLFQWSKVLVLIYTPVWSEVWVRENQVRETGKGEVVRVRVNPSPIIQSWPGEARDSGKLKARLSLDNISLSLRDKVEALPVLNGSRIYNWVRNHKCRHGIHQSYKSLTHLSRNWLHTQSHMDIFSTHTPTHSNRSNA